MKKILFWGSGMLMLLVASCNNDNYSIFHPVTPPSSATCDSSGTISYATSVAPVMALSCATSGCHDAASMQGGVVLSTYIGVHKANQNGLLIPAIKHNTPNAAPTNWMPLTGSLDPCDVAKIVKWANNGALNN